MIIFFIIVALCFIWLVGSHVQICSSHSILLQTVQAVCNHSLRDDYHVTANMNRLV